MARRVLHTIGSWYLFRALTAACLRSVPHQLGGPTGVCLVECRPRTHHRRRSGRPAFHASTGRPVSLRRPASTGIGSTVRCSGRRGDRTALEESGQIRWKLQCRRIPDRTDLPFLGGFSVDCCRQFHRSGAMLPSLDSLLHRQRYWPVRRAPNLPCCPAHQAGRR